MRSADVESHPSKNEGWGTRLLRLHTRKLGAVILPDSCCGRDYPDRSIFSVFRGPRPLPRVLDFGRFEVTRLGLQNGGTRSDNVHNLFPTMRSDHCHSSDLVCVLLEKPKLLPARLPFGSLHFCKVREDADRVLFMLGDK